MPKKNVTGTRKNLYLSDSTAQILDAIAAEGGNRSGYVDKAVQDRYTQMARARLLLKHRGWKRGELLKVLEALNGIMIPDEIPASHALAIELGGDVLDLNGRKDFVLQEVRSEQVARALLVVADEFWYGETSNLNWLT